MMAACMRGEQEWRRLIAGVTAFAFAVSLASCFSDRNATAPIDNAGECSIPLSAIGPNKIVVAMRDFAFFPDTVRIRPGTEVTWVNCETDVQDFHTSTSVGSGLWDSGAVNRGESFTRRFDTTGSFGYFCIPHPFMRGAVVVE
jgi:plastocyanin